LTRVIQKCAYIEAVLGMFRSSMKTLTLAPSNSVFAEYICKEIPCDLTSRTERMIEATASNGQDIAKVDKAARARKQQQAALFRHDIFNLLALAVVNGLNCWYLLYGRGTNMLLAEWMPFCCACVSSQNVFKLVPVPY
jgi:hypothetical protein